jgi:hypothetical protein
MGKLKKMKERREYSAVNLRHPMIMFWFLIFISFSTFMILLAFRVQNIWLTCLFIFLSLLTPFMLYYSLTSKILIDNSQLIKKSILGVKSIEFSAIKSFGVYKQEGKFARVITRDEYDKNDWFGINFIFVADREEYSPLSFRQKGSIRFHYFKELYNDIQKGIKACP